MAHADALLRRFERDTLVAIVALAVMAALLPAGGPVAGLSVLSGGGLAWFSYATAKAGVTAAMGRSGRGWTLVNTFTRYAILAVAAYVILARLRLHPVGVVVGASALVLAAAAAAVRSLRPGGSLRARR